MTNAENYFEYKRAKLNLTSFLAEMERLHKRFEMFEHAISDFDTLGKQIIVSEMKVLKSTPSVQDVQKLNAILDDLTDPKNSQYDETKGARRWSETLEYQFNVLPNTQLAESTIEEAKSLRNELMDKLDWDKNDN
tara:strand:+ start:451 stop:855 length:405 start_codon:yes stop_codon:yes gene_type:complete